MTPKTSPDEGGKPEAGEQARRDWSDRFVQIPRFASCQVQTPPPHSLLTELRAARTWSVFQGGSATMEMHIHFPTRSYEYLRHFETVPRQIKHRTPCVSVWTFTVSLTR